VGGGNAYTQSAGTTTVDGTLTAGGAGITVTGGKILGAGKLNANVTVGGSGTTPTINVGDSGKAGLLAITGSYTQLSTATMNTFVGGSTVGTQYSQLQVSGTAALAGTLTVTLASGFTPALNSTFTILTAGSVTNKFSNSTIAINGSEHFVVSYTSTSVVLTVVSGGAPISGSGAQATLAAVVPRKQQLLPAGGVKYKVGSLPRSSGHFLVAGLQKSLPRTGVIVAGTGTVGYGSGIRLPAQSSAPWEPKPSLGTRSLPLNLANVPHNLARGSSWDGVQRMVSTQRLPVATLPTKRTPVRVISPMLPRIGR